MTMNKNKNSKFSAKAYQGKDRLFRSIPQFNGIERLYLWDEQKKEYLAPPRGKCIRASKYELNENGQRVRVKRTFDSIEEARNWQIGSGAAPLVPSPSQEAPPVSAMATPILRTSRGGTLLGEVIADWKRKKFPNLAHSTQIAYEKIVKLYFSSLLNLSINEITSQRVDQWISELKDPEGPMMKSIRRISFGHELQALSTILHHYDEYFTDDGFRFPIKKRHWRDVETGRRAKPKSKDLTEEEFLKFHAELKKSKHGAVLAPLAAVQYFQALRISEAAGMYHEDVRLNLKEPLKSRLLVQRSVFFPRLKGLQTHVKLGFKNSRRFEGGIKELPIFPQAYAALVSVVKQDSRGLIFAMDGKPIEYRTIQYFYDKAFRNAGLPYTATHVLRHGWTREVFNRNLDFEAAKQLLGDTSDEAARVYAVRQAGAITGIAKKMWEESPNWERLGANPGANLESTQ